MNHNRELISKQKHKSWTTKNPAQIVWDQKRQKIYEKEDKATWGHPKKSKYTSKDDLKEIE